MFEIFMAVCALTLLECSDITVAYETLPDDNWHAVAGYDDEGNYYILVNPNVKNHSDAFMTRLMIHEIAHVIAFDQDPANVTHYGPYEEICKDLAALVGVKNRNTCRPYSRPPAYPWRSHRRE